jgi:hypothetical protein
MHPFFLGYDNLNVPFRTQEQRLNNQRHFDSGTAGTVYICQESSYPDLEALQEAQRAGALRPLSVEEIYDIEDTAAQRIRERHIFQILSVLMNSEAFDQAQYLYSNSAALQPPPPLHQLPLKKTKQYMLPTVHIDESSYEASLLYAGRKL